MQPNQPFAITTNTIPALPAPSIVVPPATNNAAHAQTNAPAEPPAPTTTTTSATTTPTREGSASKRRKVEKTTAMLIEETINKQHGIVFAVSAFVGRNSYSGRNVVASNSEDKDKDDRGYYQVEWWIMSLTPAINAIPKAGEGLTQLIIKGIEKPILFTTAVEQSEENLIGSYKNKWPLTKILDIGGKPVEPSFCPGCYEIPGIPCHVHSGILKHDANGNPYMEGPGKLEAYFFPPLDVEPYNLKFTATSRLGWKPGTTKTEVIKALDKFGQDDSAFELMNVFQIQPNEGWTIREGVIHAPGPWTTFEIQRPQDDYNLCSWTLGKRIDAESLPKARAENQMKGIKDNAQWVNLLLKWDECVDPQFKKTNYRPIQIIEEGNWGRRFRLFHDEFYGEGIEINEGFAIFRNADKRPFAGIVWTGKGRINNNPVDCKIATAREFLVTPHTEVKFESKEGTLRVYTVFPLLV